MGQTTPSFFDIHSHILPGIDDGSPDEATTLEMARIASEDGIRAIIATPHQLGNFGNNSGDKVRALVQQTQALLDANGIELKLLPGADVRIEDSMMSGLSSGTVVSLADHRKHVLLELPHEIYFSIDSLIKQLAAKGMQGILSHPERNAGLMARPEIVRELVEDGCLMQVTSGSLVGSFGPASKQMAEDLVRDGLVHFLATDAHGVKSRRPLMRRAYEKAIEMVGEPVARKMCIENPLRVVQGKAVPTGPLAVERPRKISRWFARGA